MHQPLFIRPLIALTAYIGIVIVYRNWLSLDVCLNYSLLRSYVAKQILSIPAKILPAPSCCGCFCGKLCTHLFELPSCVGKQTILDDELLIFYFPTMDGCVLFIYTHLALLSVSRVQAEGERVADESREGGLCYPQRYHHHPFIISIHTHVRLKDIKVIFSSSSSSMSLSSVGISSSSNAMLMAATGAGGGGGF